MGEFGVSDKEAKKNSSSGVVGLGVKVQKQNLEAFLSKTMTMMVPPPHNHHYPPLSSFDNDPSFAGGDGPTTYMSLTNHTNHFVNAASTSASGAALVRPLQSFHISTSTAFKSSAGGTMAASLGFPFTNAQWKELERQAMIYKYMMASVPVPPHLLISMAASRSPLDTSFNLRYSSSNDAEPGRCRRTDGKKWRCSRDVAPNHKYCERHMHRGRPRSRKPVEIQANTSNNQQIKRTCHDDPSLSTPTMTISNSTISNDGSSSRFLASTAISQPYYESFLSLDKLGVKAANFDSLASVSSDKEPRRLDWMLKGEPNSMDPEWHPLILNKRGLDTGSSSNNSASIPTCHYKDSLYMNSYDLFSSGLEQQNRRSSLYPNPLVVPMENPRSVKPRVFIDAWSNADASKRNSVASNTKLSLSSLGPSMGGGLDEDMSTIHMGLGLMDPPEPWVASSTPGGPLAEVLRSGTVATTTNRTASDPSSPVSPMVTMVSSPSGVLQKTLASLSDSSSSSSPRVFQGQF